jgi:ubiquinone/menaquinone biosynthesis C-methylase UbiE
VAGDEVVDKWAQWLLHRRDGDDPEQRAKALDHLLPIRDRVLENAQVGRGEIVLDVGAGDGLIAFGALDLVGPGGRVIFSDISEDLVEHTRAAATDIGVMERMEFVRADVTDLVPIADASVDVVTTRSVLIYVEDKAKAIQEFHRVLRPGGRVSSFEPINNYFEDSTQAFFGFEATAVSDLVAKVWAYESWDGSSDVDDPMMNFTDKDLIRYAEDAGFRDVHLELRVDVEPGTWVVDWDRMLDVSPNPNARTVGESLRGALTGAELQRFEEHLRPLADAGRGVIRSAYAYLVARKS